MTLPAIMDASVALVAEGYQSLGADWWEALERAQGKAEGIKTVVYPEWWILVPLPCVFALLSLEAIFRLRNLLNGPRQPRNEQVSVS